MQVVFARNINTEYIGISDMYVVLEVELSGMT
jgi:hypothetical protein